MRIGKLCALQWEDIDFRNKMLYVNHTIDQIHKNNADFQAITPHAFRHTFATRALENDMQIKTLSRLLGHGNIKLTMNLYCHVTEDRLVEEMKKMEQKCI